jgi:hypothetical protein
VIRKIARLCELCVSAVNNRSWIIKTQVFESARSSLCVLYELRVFVVKVVSRRV